MLSRIEQSLNDLSRTERKVGEWVIAHPRRAAEATLKEVADATGASEPTVVRFCRSLGLAGFRELTRRLTAAMSQPASYVHSDVTADDDTADAVGKVLDASIHALVELRGELPGMPLVDAVHAMASARQLLFAGFGASGVVATDAWQKFFRLGIPGSAFIDAQGLIQAAAVAAPGDVLVLISHTGEWPDLLRAARLARERGASVIALTRPQSGLAAAADLVLPCEVVEDTSVYTPLSSRLAQLALLDALYTALALERGDDAVERLYRAKRALAGLAPEADAAP